MKRGIALLVAVGCLLAPGSASARGDSFGFGLRGSNGTLVYFGASTEGDASVSAFRANGHEIEAATYELPNAQTVTRKRIVADFGPYGTIDVRYRAKRGVPSCRVPAITGTVRGVIRFRGEDGYTRASARRLKATRSPYECRGDFGRVPGSKAPRPKDAFLTSCRPADGVRYVVNQNGGRPFHTATLFEETKRLLIRRTVQYEGEPSSFVFSENPSFAATVKPKGFFAGSANYADGLLTGDLSATFLGLTDPVSLVPAEAGLFIGDEGTAPNSCRKLGR